jgi:Gpi18-like mannosyltransferase
MPAGGGSEFAFFPMWPMILKSFSAIFGPTYIQIQGLIISFVLFAATLLMICRRPESLSLQKDEIRPIQYLYSSSLIATFPLIFNPGSWIYFSNHTESLFLFLSVLAFQQAYKGNLYWSSIFAGIASVTRNQGVIVAICVGLYFLLNKNRIGRHRFMCFTISGVISGSFYITWLAFLYLKTGNIFASMDAQKHWSIIDSFGSYISNLLWLSPRNAIRALLFWSILGSSVFVILKSSQKRKIIPICTYLILSVLLWPLQGNNFPQAFRFGAVLFPFWLMVGNQLDAMMNSKSRVKEFIGVMVASFLIFMYFRVTHFYFTQSGWPY